MPSVLFGSTRLRIGDDAGASAEDKDGQAVMMVSGERRAKVNAFLPQSQKH
jgi:hypothetical protein